MVIIIGIVGFIVGFIIVSMLFRTVVPTNHVHIIQKRKKSISYGKDQSSGNVYYNYPSWIPFIGLTRIILPVSNFTIDLDNYQAYDNGKVPFGVDVKAFFRIGDSLIAAQRVESFNELQLQLTDILKGAIRKTLASEDIEKIMVGRGEFGIIFTNEVEEQLKSWGVMSVKSIELMDIRDGDDSSVISNIMEKKKSAIEKESRIEVAMNTKKAEIAEIEAQRDTGIQKEQALQAVGERQAEKNKKVGVAQEIANQEIQEQAKITTEKRMAVEKVNQVKLAEITKEVQIVKAQEDKQTDIVRAEGEKQQTVTIAEGNLTAKEKEAKGIEALGKAEAEAEKAMQLAPVVAQITLAKEIGSNDGYMNYLLGIDGIKAGENVGVEKAKALASGDLKVIANTGGKEGVSKGISSIMDLFGADGGASIGSMLDNLNNTEIGKQVLDKILKKPGKKKKDTGNIERTAAVVENEK